MDVSGDAEDGCADYSIDPGWCDGNYGEWRGGGACALLNGKLVRLVLVWL